MKNSFIHPKWWPLYLSVAFVGGLFWLETKAPFSKASHTWAEVGLVFILYCLVMVWLRANETAFLSEELEKYKEISIRNTPATPQTKPGNMVDSQHNNQPHRLDFGLDGHNLPARLISLAAIFIAFFKVRDQ